MDDIRAMDEERSVLRWGGMAGILAGVLLVLSMLVYVMIDVLAGAGLEDPEGYPGVRSARVVENTLYGAGLVLGVLHFLALYRALRRSSPAPALFGSALAILGLGFMTAGALLHIAHDPLRAVSRARGHARGARDTAHALAGHHGCLRCPPRHGTGAGCHRPGRPRGGHALRPRPSGAGAG